MSILGKIIAGALSAAILLFAIGETRAQIVNQNLGIYGRALRGQLPGTTTNDAASAGNIGQSITGNRSSGSASALTTTTALSVASAAITAGDWIVTGNACFSTAAGTTVNVLLGIISSTQNSISGTSEYNTARLKFNGATLAAGDTCLAIPPQRVSLSGTTTYYITTYADFGASTMTAYGQLTAWRMR